MLILQNAYRSIFFLFLLMHAPLSLYSDNNPQSSGYLNASSGAIEKRVKICNTPKKLSYYLYTADFINSFIDIPANIPADSTTISSKYLAGRASIYNSKNKKVGTCSASFLCMKNEDGIFTDISNYLSVDNGLIVTWFTPTTLIDLGLDSIIHSMVTECLVIASTKIGFNPFYGKKFNMVVSSDKDRIYFKLTEV